MPADVLVRAINAHLPADVVVREAADVPQAFDANRDAMRKLYRYVIHDGAGAEPVPAPLLPSQPAPARRGGHAPGRASRCTGRHDFHSFETDWPNRMSSVRTITHLASTASATGSGSMWRRTASCTIWCGPSPAR